jgi:hypothetical protein
MVSRSIVVKCYATSYCAEASRCRSLRQPGWACRLFPKQEAYLTIPDLHPQQGSGLIEDRDLLQSIAECVSKLNLGDQMPAQAQGIADSTEAGPNPLPSYLRQRMEYAFT